MTANVTWTASTPTVDGWSDAVYCGEYHQSSTYSNWYARARFRIGRVAGTRDVVIEAVTQAHKKSGWVDQTCNATPTVEVEGEWHKGAYTSKKEVGGNWTNLKTQYAVISGLRAGATVNCKITSGSVSAAEVANPITAAPVRVNIGGTWTEAEVVRVNVGGTWMEVVETHVNVDGVWKETQ